MINIKCKNIHKYGPFKKKNNNFYRICLKCNKKTIYPICDEIENEYNNQRITDYIIEIITNKKITNIQNNNYFFRLIISLLDNISYVYLSIDKQNELLESIKELNNYYNNQETNKYNLIKETSTYFKKYFENYNNEINNNYNNNLNILDKNYLIIMNKLNIELEKIIENEEKTIISIDDNYKNQIITSNINLNEAENESE